MPSFFAGDGQAALTRAISAFESATAAELVIAVRPRSAAVAARVDVAASVLDRRLPRPGRVVPGLTAAP